MSRILRGLDALASLFGPDASAQAIKNGARTEVGRREVVSMTNVARMPAANSLAREPGENIAAAPAAYAFVGKRTMSVPEWFTVTDNPRQRDTEKHAVKAKKSHLSAADPVHAMVSMAEVPGVGKYKLDGHTRCLLWQRGELEAPSELVVDVWHCANIDAVKALYSRFDAATAAETAADRLRGAAHEHAIEFKSPMLRDGNYGTAIKRVFQIGWSHAESRWSSLDYVYDAVKTFKRELQALDEINPNATRFSSGVIAAALVTLKRYGPVAEPFWRAYAENAGTKFDGSMDGVQALSEAVGGAKRIKATSGIYLQAQIMYAAFAAFEGWLKDRPFSARRRLNSMPAATARLYIRAAAHAKSPWPEIRPSEKKGA